jgi:fused signal recognition particle receptor
LSLLEQAAAQRAERQRELLALAIDEPAAPAAPGTSATPAAAPAPAAPSAWSATVAPERPVSAPPSQAPGGDSEPQLGAFDADFTWSAEVLAAQGRRADEVSLEEIDWLGRLRRGLEKTRRNFVTQLLTNLGDDPLTAGGSR